MMAVYATLRSLKFSWYVSRHALVHLVCFTFFLLLPFWVFLYIVENLFLFLVLSFNVVLRAW